MQADRAVSFPLVLRVPAWAKGATVQIGGGAAQPMTPGTMHRIDRAWSGRVDVALRFPMSPLVTARDNGAIAIERGGRGAAAAPAASDLVVSGPAGKYKIGYDLAIALARRDAHYAKIARKIGQISPAHIRI